MTEGNPFKGLAYFERDDAASFGGREKDVRAVVAGILKSRTFVLYGRSGLGKTSLMLAGVLPQLERHRCRPVVVRALADPIADLRAALLETLGGEASDPLHALVDRADDDGPVVVVFDQFEEFFIRFAEHAAAGVGDPRDDEQGSAERRQRRRRRELFVREIAGLAAADDLNLRLVFSLREDWVAQMQGFQAAIPEIGDGTYRLLPLTAFGVRASITRTLRAAGVAFDSRLISALVDNLAEVGFDPAVLQVVCSEVWNQAFLRSSRAPGAPLKLTTVDLERVGGVQGVFEDYLAQVARRIPASDLRLRLQTRAVLESTITSQRTKRAAPAEFFLHRYFAIEPRELERVMALLVEHRLVRRDARADGVWFELMHERLIDTILRWLDDDLDFFNFRAARNLLRNSCANKGWRDDPGLLLSPEQLDGTIGPYKELLRFDEEERLFLVSSATYGRSKDLEFWAELAGYGTSAELLERFLDHDNVTIRLGAAEAAGRLEDPSGRFAGRCLELAIDDPEEGVRRAAGRSFAHLASAADFQALAARIRDRKTRSRALDALDDVYEQRKMPEDGPFGPLRVRRAYERVFHRRLERSRDVIRARARIGATTGLRAGLLWAVTGMPVLTLAADPELYGCLAPVLFAPAVIAASVLLGTRAAKRAAEEAMSSGQEGRVFRALTGWLLRAVLVTPLVIALAAFVYSYATGLGPVAYNMVLSLAYPFAIALACWLVWAGLAALARPACWPGLGGRRAWLGAWLAGMATGLASLALSAVTYGRLPALDVVGTWPQLAGQALRATLGLGALAGGGVVFVGLVAVARSSPGWPGRETPALGSLPPAPARRPQARIAAAVAVISLSALVVSANTREAGDSFYQWDTDLLATDLAGSLLFESQVFGRAPRVERAAARTLEAGAGAAQGRELERDLVLEELLIPFDLERARIERRLLDLTLSAGDERALRAELETVAAGRRQAEARARQDLAAGKIDAGEVIARSPALRGLLAQRRVRALAQAPAERGTR